MQSLSRRRASGQENASVFDAVTRLTWANASLTAGAAVPPAVLD
jgi:hypothetical protein